MGALHYSITQQCGTGQEKPRGTWLKELAPALDGDGQGTYTLFCSLLSQMDTSDISERIFKLHIALFRVLNCEESQTSFFHGTLIRLHASWFGKN